MIAINNVEIFKTGDYGEKGKYTAADIDQIVKEFDAGKEDFPITVNQTAAHRQDETRERLRNAPAIGWGKKLYRSGDILMSDLIVNDDFYELLKKRMYDKRSVGLKRKGNKLLLDHLEFLGKEWPEVKNLKSLGLSLYSESEEGYIELQFNEETKKKEKPMKETDVTFSQAEVTLKIKEAVESRESELNIEFSEKIEKKDKEIAVLTERADELSGKLKEANDKILEFSETEKNRKIEAIKERVLNLSKNGIKTPEECKPILKRMLEFSEIGRDDFIEQDLAEYEKMGAVVNHEFSRGKVQDENLEVVELDVSYKEGVAK